MNYKVAICVRTDVKMSPAKLAVQVAHAAEQNLNAFIQDLVATNDFMKADLLDKYIDEGYRKVVLKVPDLNSITKLSAKAVELGIPSFIVTDFGLTELEPDTVTCIAIGPMDNDTAKKITGRLKLYDL